MSKYEVAITRYKENQESVKDAVELSNAFKDLPANAKVVIKPNILFWSIATDYPKWGVITTSTVIEQVVRLLKDCGVSSISIVEGIMVSDLKDRETCRDAHEKLGYNKLKERYGVEIIDIFERPFEKVDLGEGIELSFNTDILNSDFIVDIPVLKTHAQAVVSLGIKNLKGVLDVNSRKKCHGADPVKDLNYMISRLIKKLPPIANIIDGIYTKERGPAFDGKARRSDIIIASSDILAADMVGAKVLGHNPADVKYLGHIAKDHNRPIDLSDIEVKGEKIEDVESFHESTFPYNEGNTLPIGMEKMGIKGLSYHKYDDSMCTYCSGINGVMLTAIIMAWKGEPWDDVEVLTGKIMQPTPGKKKTILLGQCMYNLNKKNPNIQELIPIKGCPPNPMDIAEALQKAGINAPKSVFENIDKGPGFFLERYKNKPEFSESFFRIE